MISFASYTRAPSTESDDDALDDLLMKDGLGLRILRANAALPAAGDEWTDLVYSIEISDAAALLRAMPESATEVGLNDASDDDLPEIARWAFADFVCASFKERTHRGGVDIVCTCVTCGVPLSWEYPGAWCHSPKGDDSGDAGAALDAAHAGRPGGVLPWPIP